MFVRPVSSFSVCFACVVPDDWIQQPATSKQATGFHRSSSFETIDDMFERAESWMANPAMASRFSESIVSMKKQVWRFFVDALFELHFQE